MVNVKWYYIVAVALGLAAIVAIVYIVVRSDWVMEKLHSRKVEEVEA